MKTQRMVRPLLETLEDRTVPALILQLDGSGNLTGVFGVPSGDVELNGTAADEIQVIENGNDLGTYSVPGNLNVSLGNVVAATSLTLALGGNDLSGSVSLAVGNALGGYTVSAEDGGIGGNLTLRSGSGSDTLNTDGLTIAGSLSMDGGAGNDTGGNLTASTIAGNYTARNVENFNFDNVTLEGSLTYQQTSSLPSTVNLDATSTVDGGAYLTLGAGSDNVAMNSTILGNAVVNLGNGANTVNGTLGDELNVLGSFAVTGGAGVDDVTFDGLVGGNVTFSMGGGNDSATFGGATASTVLGSSVTVIGANGNDSLIIGAGGVNAPGARLTFHGQNGNDVADFSAATALVFASAYLDGGFGTNDYVPGPVITFPFILRNFV